MNENPSADTTAGYTFLVIVAAAVMFIGAVFIFIL